MLGMGLDQRRDHALPRLMIGLEGRIVPRVMRQVDGGGVSVLYRLHLSQALKATFAGRPGEMSH